MECLCEDVGFQTAFATCSSTNCTVVDTLQSTNMSRAACGIPIRDNSQAMIGMTASFGSLALLMVLLRLINRGLSHNRTIGWDDLLIGLSGVSRPAH
jgi:hypothetical protein